MAQDNIIICKALVQQGPRKNESCQRHPQENGFCIYHQRNYEYDTFIKEGKNPCGMFFRGCDFELSMDDKHKKHKNCSSCRKKKYSKEFQCQFNGCTFTINKEEDTYCKKHIRELLREHEKNKHIKYCDIERGCFQQIIEGNQCEICKQHDKTKIAIEISMLRKKHDITTILSSSTQLQKKQEDKTISVAELWRCVQKNAYSRGLLFTLSELDFESLIIKPCYYCGFQSLSRLNGIDRIDNNKGYVFQNCISCCKMCNVIKNMQHPNEFLDKVDAICTYYNNKITIITPLIKKWKSYLSTSPRASYSSYKSDSKKRQIEFLLSESEYNKLLQNVCYLCGILSSGDHANGIDRFDSLVRCYSIENSRTCCGHCNVMKGILSYSDFIEKCIQIHIHSCKREIFDNVPIYDNTYCRNEYYTSEDIYKMMITGKYMQYIKWCQEKEKTPEFISMMNQIRHLDDLITNKDNIIEQIKSEQEKERSRKATIDSLTDKKYMQCTTVYCYLTQGKKDKFIEWYQSNYDKTSLFDQQLDNVMRQLPLLSKEKGIELCKKLMYDEKNRRTIQHRRECDKQVIVYSSVILKENNQNKNEIIIPHQEIIVQKVQSIQDKKGYTKVSIPKQWKTKQIYEAIKQDNENIYKLFCEQNNTLEKTWESDWVTFVLSVKGKTVQDAEPIIKSFVENLRRIRHNQLCANKLDVVEREDREQWPATTVVKAFLEGKLDRFKTFTEAYTEENPEDPKWIKRWSTFVKSLEENKEKEDALKTLCSKFMTAQRTKKYRHSKHITSSESSSVPHEPPSA